MKRSKFAIVLIAIFGALVAIFFILRSQNALLTHPEGLIARQQLDLLVKSILLILAIIVPTYIALFFTIWRSAKKKDKDQTESKSSVAFKEVLFWSFPFIIVVALSLILWDGAHKLDPYKPIESEVKPLTINVVALDWKWLFIYPEQEIATVNFVQFPEATPIHFNLCADGSPMNSFWIPQLSGQIYAMTGMSTSLHIMADKPGSYLGQAAEINGRGYAGMTFVVKSTTQSDFENWIAEVKKSPLKLTSSAYDELVFPSENNPIALYSYVEQDMFQKIMMKYMHSH